jgi:hypothetical protein
MIDPLSEVLRSVRLTGGIFLERLHGAVVRAHADPRRGLRGLRSSRRF